MKEKREKNIRAFEAKNSEDELEIKSQEPRVKDQESRIKRKVYTRKLQEKKCSIIILLVYISK
jgi:hypothetical protein